MYFHERVRMETYEKLCTDFRALYYTLSNDTSMRNSLQWKMASIRFIHSGKCSIILQISNDIHSASTVNDVLSGMLGYTDIAIYMSITNQVWQIWLTSKVKLILTEKAFLIVLSLYFITVLQITSFPQSSVPFCEKVYRISVYRGGVKSRWWHREISKLTVTVIN